MALSVTSKVRFTMPKGMYAQDHVLVMSREMHVRDLAARILAQKLAAAHGCYEMSAEDAEKPTELYRAALVEAEERLYADF